MIHLYFVIAFVVTSAGGQSVAKQSKTFNSSHSESHSSSYAYSGSYSNYVSLGSEYKVELAQNFSSVEDRLRSHILSGNIYKAAETFNSRSIISLGAGLTYPEELEALVTKSQDRNQDPDVVAFKAMAAATIAECSNAFKVALAATLSLQPDCQCAATTAEERDEIFEEFLRDFSDKAEMLSILQEDANKEEVGSGRKLRVAGGSPTRSFVCAYCWPRRKCKKMHWC